MLLTSLTFAVAAVRLARLGALVQRLNAVESLASVDVVCVDKTGTLTDNRLSVVAVDAAHGTDSGELRGLLGAVGGQRRGPQRHDAGDPRRHERRAAASRGRGSVLVGSQVERPDAGRRRQRGARGARRPGASGRRDRRAARGRDRGAPRPTPARAAGRDRRCPGGGGHAVRRTAARGRGGDERGDPRRRHRDGPLPERSRAPR